MVLKVENGVPNPDDSLRIFCDVIGVTLYREADQVPLSSSERPLFIDYPGLNLYGYDNPKIPPQTLVLKMFLPKCWLSMVHMTVRFFPDLST